MILRQYQVDAFTDQLFGGNPAAVVPLSSWLDEALMQAIAEENNLSETAFFVPAADGFALRWFTPITEVDLCGHATLAAAHVVFSHLGYSKPAISFSTRSGKLIVRRSGELLQMDFPAQPPLPCPTPKLLREGLGAVPSELLVGDDYLAVFDSEEQVRAITPDHTLLGRLDRRGVIITAPGNDIDFVSRFFAPKFGIPEDPVTGSAHCLLTPYWSKRLGKNCLTARQVSRRGGDIACELVDDRVLLSGRAVTFLQAEITLPDFGTGNRG